MIILQIYVSNAGGTDTIDIAAMEREASELIICLLRFSVIKIGLKLQFDNIIQRD